MFVETAPPSAALTAGALTPFLPDNMNAVDYKRTKRKNTGRLNGTVEAKVGDEPISITGVTLRSNHVIRADQ